MAVIVAVAHVACYESYLVALKGQKKVFDVIAAIVIAAVVAVIAAIVAPAVGCRCCRPSLPLPSIVIVVDHCHDCDRHTTIVSAAQSMAEGTSVEPAGGAEKAPHSKARGMGA